MNSIDRGCCLALALHSCTVCFGLGRRQTYRGETTPCHCVYRAIFRQCYARFRQCSEHGGYMGRVDLDRLSNGAGLSPRFSRNSSNQVFGLRRQEYAADFVLVAKRSLTAAEHRLFRYHFLLGADWKLCTRKLDVDRGTFYHSVYRIQQKLGRVFAALEPHALWPLDEYFGGATGRVVHPMLRVSIGRHVAPEEEPQAMDDSSKTLRFPLAKAA